MSTNILKRRVEKDTFLNAYRLYQGDVQKALGMVATLPNREGMTFNAITVRGWCIRDQAFAQAYEEAKREVAAWHGDRMPGLATKALNCVEDILDNAENDIKLRASTQVLKSVGIFTDRMATEHTGSGMTVAIQVQVVSEAARKLTEAICAGEGTVKE